MSVTFNGTTLKQMTYNGVKVKKWNHNGTRVFTAGSTVTYWVDSGTSYTEEVDSEASCLSPKTFTPTKSGWTFIGWREDKTASSNVLSSKVMGDSPITLYAVFRATITVTYYNPGPSIGSTSGYRYYNNGNVVNPSFVLTQPEVEDWVTTGWSVGTAADSKTTYNNGATFTRDSNITLYGMYQRTIILSYNGNGAISGSVSSQSKIWYYNSNGVNTPPTFTLAANEFALPEYNWTAWAIGSASGNQYRAGESVTLMANTTFYACWTIKYYSVSYVYGGSTVYTGSYPSGSLVSGYIPSAVSGRTFIGWTSSSGGTSAETIYATANMTLYGIGSCSGTIDQGWLTGNPGYHGDDEDYTVINISFALPDVLVGKDVTAKICLSGPFRMSLYIYDTNDTSILVSELNNNNNAESNVVAFTPVNTKALISGMASGHYSEEANVYLYYTYTWLVTG